MPTINELSESAMNGTALSLTEYAPGLGILRLVLAKRIDDDPLRGWCEGLYLAPGRESFALLYLGEPYSRYGETRQGGIRRPGLWCRRICRGEALEWLEQHCTPREFCDAFKRLGQLREGMERGHRIAA